MTFFCESTALSQTALEFLRKMIGEKAQHIIVICSVARIAKPVGTDFSRKLIPT